jgi:hypothetical protein
MRDGCGGRGGWRRKLGEERGCVGVCVGCQKIFWCLGRKYKNSYLFLLILSFFVLFYGILGNLKGYAWDYFLEGREGSGWVRMEELEL